MTADNLCSTQIHKGTCVIRVYVCVVRVCVCYKGWIGGVGQRRAGLRLERSRDVHWVDVHQSPLNWPSRLSPVRLHYMLHA